MWAIDLTHTSHTNAQTGIQQVSRALFTSLRSMNLCVPVVFDRFAGSWREPDRRENRLLMNQAAHPSGKRSPRWTVYQKIRGGATRVFPWIRQLPPVAGIFFPEILGRERIETLFAEPFSRGPGKVALFHDAIPMKFPDWCSPGTVADFPAYLRCIARFDHIACVSETSRSDLLEQWDKLKIKPTATSVVPLGLPRLPKVEPTPRGNCPPVVLSVGTLEPRKNHAALISAAEKLWNKGIRFKLILAGMANAVSAKSILQQVDRVAKSHPIEWTGPVDNHSMDNLLQRADIMAYPSLYEGFGLPVLEALACGKPVLTTTFGALKERVSGGGCKVCDGSVDGIRDGLEALLVNDGLRQKLAMEAGQRQIPTMEDTAKSLAGIFDQLETGNPSIS